MHLVLLRLPHMQGIKNMDEKPGQEGPPKNELQIAPPGGRSYFNIQAWKAMSEMARVFFQSQAIPSYIKNAAQLVVILQAGRELGMMPIESISNLYIVNGKVALQGVAMLNKVLAAGVKLTWVEETEEKCTVKFEGLGRPAYTASFTIKEAEKAGLLAKGGPWKLYPKNMLRWRALSFGARIFCPDIIQGMHSVEELANVKMVEDGVFEPVQDSKNPSPQPPKAPEAPKAPAEPKATAPAPNKEAEPASKAQVDFLVKLATEKGVLDKYPTEGLTRSEASKKIDELKALPAKKEEPKDPPPPAAATDPTPQPAPAEPEVLASKHAIDFIKLQIRKHEPDLPDEQMGSFLELVLEIPGVLDINTISDSKAKEASKKLLNFKKEVVKP